MAIRTLRNIPTDLPKAVLFDLDNTLYDYNGSHLRAMSAVAVKAEQLLGLNRESFESAYDRARAQVQADLKGTASSHSRLLYFQRMVEMLGLKTQVLLTLDFEQTYWRTFLSGAQLFDGARELIEELRSVQVPVAVVTDLTAQIQFRKLVYFQLDSCFDYIVTSEEAGHDKPSALPYQLVLSKLRVSSGPIWMVGDSAVADVKGARVAIDAITFQKRHPGVEVGQGEYQPDVVFDSFLELLRLVKGLSDEGSLRQAV